MENEKLVTKYHHLQNAHKLHFQKEGADWDASDYISNKITSTSIQLINIQVISTFYL